ncbi:hypothetical protein HWV62_31203 [Athelia sp. TMB]|nr:hypothetical protein HWV62_31203 [Athelia sp. TMB]
MATPSSSATSASASPPHSFLHPSSPPAPPQDDAADDERKQAVQKFLARAEISMISAPSLHTPPIPMHTRPPTRPHLLLLSALPPHAHQLTHPPQVTRGLRARLSYASFKAAHNIPHVPLRDLEAQSASHYPNATTRLIGAKRKPAPPANNYYNNPATQAPQTSPRARAMPPPGARSYYPATSASTGNGRPHPALQQQQAQAHTQPYAQLAQQQQQQPARESLYASLLAPPPAKQARTIHNPRDPPVPAPLRPAPLPTAGRKRAHSVAGAEGAAARRPTPRARKPAKGKAHVRAGGSLDLRGAGGGGLTGEMDLKAAATLTSLLHAARSPRSAAGSLSDAGGSLGGFAQSAARGDGDDTHTPPALGTPVLAHAAPNRPRAATLSAGSTHSTVGGPSDSEAADLMLFLATSPSPVRPAGTPREAPPRLGLGGGAGRVLFAGGLSRESSTRTEDADAEGDADADADVDMHDAAGGVNVIPPTPIEQAPPASALLPPAPARSPKLSAPTPTHGAPFSLAEFIGGAPGMQGVEGPALGAGIDLAQ